MAWIPNVNANELITSAWGNTIRDHVVNTFNDAAARDSAIPAPVAGMTCWVTSLKATQVYDGTAWRIVPGSGVAPAAYVELTAGAGDAGTTAAYTGMSVTFTTPGNRRMRMSGQVTMMQTASGPSPGHLEVRDGATVIYHALMTMGVGYIVTYSFSRVVTPTAGSHTYDTFYHTDVGTMNIRSGADYAAHLLVQDIGG